MTISFSPLRAGRAAGVDDKKCFLPRGRHRQSSPSEPPIPAGAMIFRSRILPRVATADHRPVHARPDQATGAPRPAWTMCAACVHVWLRGRALLRIFTTRTICATLRTPGKKLQVSLLS
jgi:hypothetical protein